MCVCVFVESEDEMKSKFVGGDNKNFVEREDKTRIRFVCECIEGGESIGMDFNLGNKPN
jgi:hypothetical protein